MKVLPWLLMIAALAAAGWFYSDAQHQRAELAAARTQLADLPRLREAETELEKLKAEVAEVPRLRRENEELHRLRGEVTRLQQETKQLTQQLQNAEARAARTSPPAAPPQPAVPVATPATGAQPGAPAVGINVQGELTPEALARAKTAMCINFLRLIQEAKQQWARDQGKPANAVPTREELVPYMKSNIFPPCPEGGTYTINSVTIPPTCSHPGHVLPP